MRSAHYRSNNVLLDAQRSLLLAIDLVKEFLK
jgi:hypothetical protein